MSNTFKVVIVAVLLVAVAVTGYTMLTSPQPVQAAQQEYEQDTTWGCLKACYAQGGDIQACIARCNGKDDG